MRSPLPADWSLPEAIAGRLGERAGRQRSMAADGHLLVILHAPPDGLDWQREERLFWRAPDGTWRSKGLGGGSRGLAAQLDEATRTLADLEAEVTAVDLGAERMLALLRRLSPLVRFLANQAAALQQARELVPKDRDLIALRDRAVELERGGELLYQDLRHALDVRIALQAEAQAQAGQRLAAASHRLNVLAAVFLPLVALTSVFGMNLHSGFPATNPAAFWMVLCAGIAAGAGMLLFVRRL